MFATHAIDLILTGHDHDLFINYDERDAMVESSYDAHYVTAIDVTISVKEQDGKRATTWRPQFRVIDTATVTPDPEVAAVVAKFEAELSRELDVPLGTTAVELDSRNATVRTREAAIGNLIADAMRASTKADVAIMNGGGIRAGKVYRAGLGDHPARCAGGVAVRQSRGGRSRSPAPSSRPRSRTGCRNCPTPAGASRRCRA